MAKTTTQAPRSAARPQGGKPQAQGGKPTNAPRPAAAAAPAQQKRAPVPAQQARAVDRPVEEPQRSLVVAGADALAELDQGMLDSFSEDDALGVSYDAEDNLLQFIKVLQPLSPEVMAGEAQVEGAEAGDFFCRGMDPELHKSIWFQPCGLKKFWLEFIPREQGGGFVGRYECNLNGPPIPPEGAAVRPENRNALFFPDTGNSCTLYRVVPGILWFNQIPNEFVLNFYGTGHSVHRQWNGRMLKKINPRTRRAFPSYSHLYELTTSLKSNKKGKWFQIGVSGGTPIWSSTAEEIVGDRHEAEQNAKLLARAFAAGEREAKFEEPTEGEFATDGEIIDANESVQTDDIPY